MLNGHQPTPQEFHGCHPNQCYACQGSLRSFYHVVGDAKLCSAICAERFRRWFARLVQKPPWDNDDDETLP